MSEKKDLRNSNSKRKLQNLREKNNLNCINSREKNKSRNGELNKKQLD